MKPKSLQSLSASELTTLEEKTISHYEQKAEDFWEGTKDHDVSQNREALLRHIESKSPYRILDFGCGPGRDLAAFLSLGHEPVGLDGCEEFVRMAHAHTGCEVFHQSFLRLDLPSASFDGVFANASIFFSKPFFSTKFAIHRKVNFFLRILTCCLLNFLQSTPK